MRKRQTVSTFSSKAVLALLVATVVVLSGCADDSDPTLDLLVATDPTAYDSGLTPESRIQELEAEITRYRSEVQEQTIRLGSIATYQKMLARELIEAEMYGPALEALSAAMELQSDNAVLYYLAGVAAARSARGEVIDGGVAERLSLAEELYRQALAIRPDYQEALYGLSVLLAFELDRPEEAEPFARRLARLETGDPAIAFLLANVLVRNGAADEAADIYADLARSAPAAEQRRQAAANRDALLGGAQ